MDPERWALIQEIFHAALERPAVERDAFVRAACGTDDELQREVAALLAADAIEGDLFDSPPGALLGGLAEEALRHEAGMPSLEGRRVGPYVLRSLLGRGGMGSVYLAEREDVGLRCALKLVRGGLATPEMVDRFLFERRVLARLEHPNIARMLDAGVADDDTPWFAMELVDGEPIDRYCDARRLGVAERLRLFEAVCEAVADAHRNLVVHRDLKPRNILVTAEGVPKLLDFGIAKLLDDAHDPALTGTGTRLFTPEYAAPEQLGAGPATTATDVYALGLVLYELLCGRRAVRREGGAPAMAGPRVSGALPPRPSTAAGRDTRAATRDGRDAVATAAEVAAARGSDPAQLRRRLAGDLDAIVLRALAPEPERRYPSVAALLEDLRRHRHGFPVHARPDSRAYRVGRFIRRHKLPVAAVVALVLLLSGFAASMRLQMAATARARDRAEAEAARANQVSAFLIEIFDVADPFSTAAVRVDSLTIRDFFIERGRKVSELEAPPEVQVPVLNVVGHMYFSLGLHDQALPMYERALELGRRLHPDGAEERATTLNHLGELHRITGDLAAAEREHREALRLARALHAEPHETRVTALNGLGETLRYAGRYAEAEPVQREALAERRAVYGERSAEAADGLNNLGLLLWAKGDAAAAEPLLEEALAIHRVRLPRVHPMTSAVLNNLGLVRQQLGDMAGAEPLLREALEIKRDLFGDHHWRIANGLINLANLLVAMDRPAAAEPFAREALAVARDGLGEESELVGVALQQLAGVREQEGDRAEAERYLRRSLEVLEAALPADHPRIAATRVRIARLLLRDGRADEARPHLRRALELYEERGDSTRAVSVRELLAV